MLEIRDTAPAFNSVNQDNKPISLDDYRGRKYVILYFYPKDDTPGCTIQANQFTDLAADFAKHNTVVLGVSKDDCDSHRGFVDKFSLKIDLLADTSGSLCEAYKVWTEKEKNGIKKMGILRSTFLINKEGILEDVIYGVTPEGHASHMLSHVIALQK